MLPVRTAISSAGPQESRFALPQHALPYFHNDCQANKTSDYRAPVRSIVPSDAAIQRIALLKASIQKRNSAPAGREQHRLSPRCAAAGRLQRPG